VSLDCECRFDAVLFTEGTVLDVASADREYRVAVVDFRNAVEVDDGGMVAGFSP
jgi:hypothetical protein